ncbi:MAG TPA: isoaspartyl peptidase/L-asparaginase family protein [Vicinamibacteria bacterium]
MKPALIVHGGCGTPPASEERSRYDACERAADAGWAILKKGGGAEDAVEAAVRWLEDEPVLNAGTGSYLQADGVARLDASLMTSDGRAGAVAQVPGLKNPIRLARYLLEQDAHVMLSGREALELALRLGHEAAVVATPGKIAYWLNHLSDAYQRLDYEGMGADWKKENPRRLGTVGCVAVDAQGRLAAGTSTGGTGQCYPGRVGDTPIIGAGTYCTANAAVSMTGVGERIMVLLSAKRLADLRADGRDLEAAAGVVMEELARVEGAAGLIAIDASGEMVEVKNTPFMAAARRA